MIISFCATQTIKSWHKLEVAKSPLIIDQYAKVGIVLESWRAGDNDRHQDFQFWCRVSHEKWATRLGFNYLPITSAAHYSRMYSRLRIMYLVSPCLLVVSSPWLLLLHTRGSELPSSQYQSRCSTGNLCFICDVLCTSTRYVHQIDICLCILITNLQENNLVWW